MLLIPNLEYQGHLFSICLKVTRFSLKEKTVIRLVLTSGSRERFLKFRNQATHLETLWDPVASEISELPKRFPSLQRLKIDSDCTATLECLLDASQILGKNLKTLYVSQIRKTQMIKTPSEPRLYPL
ncbi:hypothetical protein HZ326_6163 [Fusarium oxysporum f. sp. albedinis]|nr:hypothetical protein HZ326_6163 [Fusarium oxysporum f. sp. albedinis]